MPLILRPERPADHRDVELLTRDAFWGSEGPRCSEPLLVRRLRTAESFVPELDLVAELDGVLVGHVIWSRASVVGDRVHEVLTFGPLSVLPSHQGLGVGRALMVRTLDAAARLGHRAVVVYGHPDYYPRFGFVRGADVGITAPGGATFDALMARPLVDGGLDGVHGEFHEDPAFQVDMADAEAFDLAEYPPKDPATLTPLDVLRPVLSPRSVEELRAAGHASVETVKRMSAREVAVLVGAGERDALSAYLRGRGVAWGAREAR